MIDALKKIESNEPKKFWNMIKKMNSWGKEIKDVTDKIPPKKWHKYYKALLNSNDPSCSEVNPMAPYICSTFRWYY